MGKVISVSVSYTDGWGTHETVTSDATAEVGNVNDTPVGVPEVFGDAVKFKTLSADTSSINDADGLGSFTYQWLANGQIIDGATLETFTLTRQEVGKTISVEVKYTDGEGTEETLISAATPPVESFVFDANKVTKFFENSSGFQINTFTEGGQSRPEITELTDGNFVCIWQSFHQVYDGSNRDIFGQILNRDGEKIGEEFQINTDTQHGQENAVIAALDNGNFVVAWYCEENFIQDIKAQIFDKDGKQDRR